MRWLRTILFAFLFLVALLLTLWTVGALYFDSSFPALRASAAILYLIVVLCALIFLRRGHKGLLVA